MTLAVALLASVGFVTSAATADAGVPDTDPSAVGSIGLCTQSGTQITTGNVNAVPFVGGPRHAPAPAPYSNAGRTATLFAYQPQQGLTPGEWSGDELTASSSYSNPADPMAAATGRDFSLEDFIQEYPPRWDGYLQLRIYLSTANEAAYEVHYPALNIKVTGDTWTAVGGATVNCVFEGRRSRSRVWCYPPRRRRNPVPAPASRAPPAPPPVRVGRPRPRGTTGGSGTHPAGPTGTSGTSGGTRLGRGTALVPMKLKHTISHASWTTLCSALALCAFLFPPALNAAADTDRQVMVRDITNVEGVRDNLLGGLRSGDRTAWHRRHATDHLYHADAGQCHAEDGGAGSLWNRRCKKCGGGVYHGVSSAICPARRETRCDRFIRRRCPQPGRRHLADERDARSGWT